MTLRERIRQAVDGMPDEGAVTLPVQTLRRWLGEGEGEGGAGVNRERGSADVADLTVEELAEALDKSESTVRGWMPELPGSYKLGGAWRISRADWRSYLDKLAESEEEGPTKVRSRPGSDLDDWREGRAS